MSELTDGKQSADPASRKRFPSPDRDEGRTIPRKSSKVSGASGACNSDAGSSSKETPEGDDKTKGGDKEPASVRADRGSDSANGTGASVVNNSKSDGHDAGDVEQTRSADARGSSHQQPGGKDAEETAGTSPSTPRDQSDSAAIAAAEALASLTRRDGEDSRAAPCSSERAKQVSKFKRGGHQSSRASSKTQAAAADSSTSVHSTDREDADDLPEADEGDESISGSSSTPSSSFPSDNEDVDDGECAIVSVKMAPEMRQSVALLAQIQMRLEALEKKSARLHQRLELKIGRLRRPHLDQRSSIAKTIPGFWVTALLNHPHLSAHIDEVDEDALSYMTDLEVETLKINKLGYRIRFYFKRNPYFQNNIIMKELHLGLRGSPMSFSNPILWHRGQNLTAQSEPRKSSRGFYHTFFNWFSDHSNPGQDDVAQILKDDLYRDPLRYYITPLWEPRENGSGGSGARAAEGGNGDECVVISDSDDEPGEDAGEAEQGPSREEEGEEEEEDEEEVEEENEDDEEEEDDEDDERGPSADESAEETDVVGEIVIDGSDDSEQEEEEP